MCNEGNVRFEKINDKQSNALGKCLVGQLVGEGACRIRLLNCKQTCLRGGGNVPMLKRPILIPVEESQEDKTPTEWSNRKQSE